ncbi:MAG: putative 4-hydroxybenzoate polyprenyltransferase [Leptospiraceae bacterium]|nr:putative 4-hydroxybenzoate polyprenyltransferase [Leptospiraceae bacterium]
MASASGLLQTARDYLGMIKFSHSIFALPFAGIGIVEVLSWEGFSIPQTTVLIHRILACLVCMVSLRSAAMGFNRIVDRHFDAANPRTATREIPSGKIPLSSAILFTSIALIIFVLAAFSMGMLVGWLSFAAIAFVLGYSWTKRFTYLCHFFLGLAIGLVPSAVWIAFSGTLDWIAVYWSLGLALYIAGFDIIYSCQDADFDRSRGLHSLPARLGVNNALWMARLSHVLALACFLRAGLEAGNGLVFFLGLIVVAGLFFYEHYLVRGGREENIPLAFFNINAYVSSVLFVILLADRWILPITL